MFGFGIHSSFRLDLVSESTSLTENNRNVTFDDSTVNEEHEKKRQARKSRRKTQSASVAIQAMYDYNTHRGPAINVATLTEDPPKTRTPTKNAKFSATVRRHHECASRAD